MTLPKTSRRGFTMVELLIVIAISMLLIAISIPLIRPMLASNQLRESTRQLNTFIVGAKARAAETGRPCGIRLIRSSVDQTGDPNECYRVQYVEVPPFYCGDVDGALINVGGQTPMPSGFEFFASVPFGDPANQLLANVPMDTSGSPLVSPGDLIRFGYAGIWYRINEVFTGQGHTAMNDTVLRLTTLSNPAMPPAGIGYTQWPINPADPGNPNAPYSTQRSLPYQILRKPQVSGSTILELPQDTSVDLGISGFSSDAPDFYADNPGLFDPNHVDSRPIDIVFEPNGQMKYVAMHGALVPATSSIFLHVGQTENVFSGVGARGSQPNPNLPSPTFPGPQLAASANLASNDNYWVTIQYPSGSVLTAENLGSAAPDLVLTRDLARSGIAKGSR